MSGFYIVPPRLLASSLDSSNFVTSINGYKGDLSLGVDTTLNLNVSGGKFTFSAKNGLYVLKTGDTITANILFRPAGSNYGLAVGAGNTTPPAGVAGALFFNTAEVAIKVHDGTSWGTIPGVGITQAAHAFDIELSTINAPSLDFLTGEHIAPQIIAAGPLPDAIFAGNDALALGIMNYFHKVGIPVPGQVSVLGYDNVSYAESALVPLTTVSQTPYQLGWTMGSQLALEFLANDDHVHQHVVFQPKIVERSSTTQKI